MVRLRESLSHVLVKFELLFQGISSGFPLINHFDLPDSVSIFGSSQEPPMHACSSLEPRWILVTWLTSS